MHGGTELEAASAGGGTCGWLEILFHVGPHGLA